MEYARLADGPSLAVRRALTGNARGISVATSGSTGTPRDVLLSTEAIMASVRATHDALGGPGQWLLCVPETRVAGAMVLARSHVAGTTPVRVAPGRFTAQTFADAVAGMDTSARRYAALVPTQWARVMGSSQGRDALAQCDAVLVGGAALHYPEPPAHTVVTYGASETCGGCVYNGMAIGDTQVRVVDGLIRLAGATLADGYADGDNSRFVNDAGTRWFVTSDAGSLGADGRLTVLGRADDVIISGGLKFHPGPIEAAMQSLPWVGEAVVVGVPDPQWGEKIVAVVESANRTAVPTWTVERSQLAGTVEREAIPKECIVVSALPRLASGKIDRAGARQLAEETHDKP